MALDADEARNRELILTPLGEPWSGRARYAAAMYFYGRRQISDEVLEVYRLCSRLDAEDPLEIIRSGGFGADWLDRIQDWQRSRGT